MAAFSFVTLRQRLQGADRIVGRSNIWPLRRSVHMGLANRPQIRSLRHANIQPLTKETLGSAYTGRTYYLAAQIFSRPRVNVGYKATINSQIMMENWPLQSNRSKQNIRLIIEYIQGKLF